MQIAASGACGGGPDSSGSSEAVSWKCGPSGNKDGKNGYSCEITDLKTQKKSTKFCSQ